MLSEPLNIVVLKFVGISVLTVVLNLNIAFIHHEGRNTQKTYNETQKYTMNIQTKIQKL